MYTGRQWEKQRMMYVDKGFEKELRRLAKETPFYDGNAEERAFIFVSRFLTEQAALLASHDERVRAQAMIAADGQVDVALLLKYGLRYTDEKAAAIAAKTERRLIELGVLVAQKKSGVLLNAKGATTEKLRGAYGREAFETLLPVLRYCHHVLGFPERSAALFLKEFYASDLLNEGLTDEQFVSVYQGILNGDNAPQQEGDGSEE